MPLDPSVAEITLSDDSSPKSARPPSLVDWVPDPSPSGAPPPPRDPSEQLRDGSSPRSRLGSPRRSVTKAEAERRAREEREYWDGWYRLLTCGTALFTRPQMYRPESVTVHEAGHQFWYGLVGNNEFEAAWLDEGLNSYSDSEALFRRYGPQRATTSYGRLPRWGVRPAPLPGGSPLARVLSAERIDLPFTEVDLRPLAVSDFVSWWRDTPRLTFVEEWTDPRWSDRSRYLRSPDSDPIDTPGWMYVDRQSYSTNSYPRTAVALRSLIGVVGREAFQRGMRRFSDEWRYRHPYPEDF